MSTAERIKPGAFPPLEFVAKLASTRSRAGAPT